MNVRPARHVMTTAAVAVSLTLTACAADQTTSGPGDPGVVHVHGVAGDPASDGAVFAATHTGLFRIDDGNATRMGDAWHDLMGFTVAGDGVLYASGHPDLQDDDLAVDGKPPLLGLVRSDDGGATWRSVSLLGEVDFHALTVVDDTIFGGDSTSGQLLASTDGETWERRGEIGFVSVAGRSTGGDVVLVGSTTDAVVVSRDGGWSWDETDVGAGWVTVAGDMFVVPQLDGTVVVSSDGASWEQRGELASRPSAVGAGDGELFAATEDGIVRSGDGGTTWETLYRPT